MYNHNSFRNSIRILSWADNGKMACPGRDRPIAI